MSDDVINQIPSDELNPETIFDVLEQKEEELRIATERFDELCQYQNRIMAAGGIDFSTAASLENYQPGILSSKVNMRSFTQQLSKTNYNVTVEQLSVSIEDVTVLIAAIISFILFIVGFIITLLGASGGRSRSDSFYLRFESKSDYHIYIDGRTTKIDSHITDSQFIEYRDKMVSYLENHYAEEFKLSRLANSLRTASRHSWQNLLTDFLDEGFSRRLISHQSSLTASITPHFSDVLKNLPNSSISQFRLVDEIGQYLPKAAESLDKFKSALTSVDDFITDNIKIIIDVETNAPASERIQAAIDFIDGRVGAMSAITSAERNISHIGRGEPYRIYKTLKEKVQWSMILKDEKEPAEYNGKIKPARFYIADLPLVKRRPSNVMKLDVLSKSFQAFKSDFDELATISERGLNQQVDDKNRAIQLQARLKKFYLVRVKQIVADMAAGIAAAMALDKAYTRYAIGLESAYRRDAHAYIHHYNLLISVASTTELKDVYRKIESDFKKAVSNHITL